MSYCNCGCARELDRLYDQVRVLASIRYDLERKIDERRAAIRSVSEDLQGIAS